MLHMFTRIGMEHYKHVAGAIYKYRMGPLGHVETCAWSMHGHTMWLIMVVYDRCPMLRCYSPMSAASVHGSGGPHSSFYLAVVLIIYVLLMVNDFCICGLCSADGA